MSYELVDTSEGLERLKDDWEALEERAPSHVFQTHRFVSSWQRLVGDQAAAVPLVVALRREEELAAVAPFCLFPARSGLRLITWLGGLYVVDYGDVLFDPSMASVGVGEFVGQALSLARGRARLAPLMIANVRHDAIAYPALAERLRPYKHSAAPFVRLDGDFDGYVASLSRKVRSNVTRRIRRLEEQGELAYGVVAKDDPELDTVIDLMLGWKKARYAELESRTAYGRPGYEEFRRDQARIGPGAEVRRLTLDGRTIAAEFGYVYRDRFYQIVTSFDEGSSRASPGSVLAYHSIRDAYERGVAIWDFCLGEEAYKYEWATGEMPQTTFVQGGIVGRFMSAAGDVRRRFAGRPGGRHVHS